MEGFPTFKGSWPWPWPWIGSYCIPSCITHRPLPTHQISLKSKKLFEDGQMYVRKYIWDWLYQEVENRQSNRHAYPHPRQNRPLQHTSLATVTIFVTVWPWPLTFWFLGQCMPSNCYKSISVPSLVSIAHTVFLLEHRYRQTDKQTDATERPTHASSYAGVGK